MFLSFFPSLISFFNVYLSVVLAVCSLLGRTVWVNAALCWQTGSFYIVWCFISLMTVCWLHLFEAVWQCWRGNCRGERFHLSTFPGHWCPLCTDSALSTHSVHRTRSCRKPCCCSPEWTATFNNSSDLVRRVQNESGGKRGRLRSGAPRCFLSKTATKWTLVITEWLLFWFCFNNSRCCHYKILSTVADPRRYGWGV